MSIEFPPECAWLFAILTGEVPPDGDEDKMFALAEVHRDLHGKLNGEFQALVAEALGFTKDKFGGDAATMYQEAMKSFLGGQEGLDYFKAVGDQAQLMADFTRKSATQLQYTKYMIIAQLVALLIEAAIAAATAFFFGASIAVYLQKMAIVRVILKSWIGRMIVTLLTHQIINVGMGVAMDAMIQWVQLNQGSRDEWDTDLTKNAALSGMVQGILAGPFNFLGDRFGKLMAKMFGLDSGRDLGKQIDKVLKKPDADPDVPLPKGNRDKVPDPKPEGSAPPPKAPAPKPETESPAPPGRTKPEPEGATPPPDSGKPRTETPEPEPKPTKKDPEPEKASPQPSTPFARDLTEAFGKHLPKTHGPAGPLAAEAFVKDVGEAFRKQFGAKAGDDIAREAGENWARTLLEKTGTRGLPDDLGGALKPITDNLGGDLTKVLTKGVSDALGAGIMRTIVEGAGRGVFEGAHAAVSEGMYNLIFSDEHTFTTSGLTFASGMVEGRLGAMMEAGGENLAMGLRGNLGMEPPSGPTGGDIGTGSDADSSSAAVGADPEKGTGSLTEEVPDYGLDEFFAHEDDDLDYLVPWEGDSSTSEGNDDGDGLTGPGGRDGEQPVVPPLTMTSGPTATATGAGGGTSTSTAQSPAAQPSGTGGQQPKSQTNASDTSGSSGSSSLVSSSSSSSSNSGPGEPGSTAHKPADISTQRAAPPQGQTQTQTQGGDQGNEEPAGQQSRPVTESTVPAVGDHEGSAPRSSTGDENTTDTPIPPVPPVTSSDGTTVPAANSPGDTAPVEARPVPDTASDDSARDHDSARDRTRAEESVQAPMVSTPSPDAEQQTSSDRRSRVAPDETPLFPPSLSPLTDGSGLGSGAHRAQGVMRPAEFEQRTTTSDSGPREIPRSVVRPGEGMMTAREFEQQTPSSRFVGRSKSEINAVDKALAGYHRLPGDADPSDRAYELGNVVKACDTYLQHKGSGGGSRVDGVKELRERASVGQVEAFLRRVHELPPNRPAERRTALEQLVTMADKYLKDKGDGGGPHVADVGRLREQANIAVVDTAVGALHGLPDGAGPMDRLAALRTVAEASDKYFENNGDRGGPRADVVREVGEQARTEGSRLGEETFRERLGELDTLVNEGRLHEAPTLPGDAQKAALAIRADRFQSIMGELVQKLFALRADTTLPEVTGDVIGELMNIERLVTVMQYGKGGMKLTSATDAAPAFTFNVDAQARSGTSFLLGHIAHELTHVAAHQAFGSSPVMELAPTGTTVEGIRQLAKERREVLADLKKDLDGSTEFGGPGDVRRLLLDEKLGYGKQKGKLGQYAQAFWSAKTKKDAEAAEATAAGRSPEPGPRQLTEQERDRLLAWDKAADEGSGTLVEYDTVLNQMLVYLHQWDISEDNPFYVRLKEAAEVAYDRREAARQDAAGTATGPVASPVPTTSGQPPATPTTTLQTSQAPAGSTTAPTRPAPGATSPRPPRVMVRPAGALPGSQDASAFDGAAWAAVHTERFDPKLGQSDRRPGLLNGSTTLIRNHVRREHSPDGGTVRHFVITLPVRPVGGLGDGDVRQLETRLQRTLDETLNSGYDLPRSGDRLRVTVELEPDATHGEAVTLTRDREPGRADQLHWDLAHGDGTLVHELLHYLGLPDEYLDTTDGRKTDDTHVFRSDSRLTGVRTTGPMVGAERSDLDTLPLDHLQRIEDVSDTVNIPSHTRGPSTSELPTLSTDTTGTTNTTGTTESPGSNDTTESRLAPDADPAHPPSGSPPQRPPMPSTEEFERNTTPSGTGPGAASASAPPNGREVMSFPEFDKETTSGRRSNSTIGDVDHALRAFHDLPADTGPGDRIAALGRVVLECDKYLAHKGDKDGSRVDGVRKLGEQANIGRVDIALKEYHRVPADRDGARLLALKDVVRASEQYLSNPHRRGTRDGAVQLLIQRATDIRSGLDSGKVFRDLLVEVDGTMRRGENPDMDKRLINDEMRDAARAMAPADFHRMMDDLVQDLNTLRDDSALPAVTGAVIGELMEVKDLVTVMRPTIAKPGMALTPDPDGNVAYTFYVDTQSRGGSSFLLPGLPGPPGLT
ncbi:hypothetical protein, partial [Streptomyces sp. NPDC058953]|uniref:WXG100-like domain-containing protein n=1 Tax=Streptomyces sp. NPDC058953 TaxID=3346676 RepID=UPI0036B2FFAA